MLLRKINVTNPILPAPSADPWMVHAGKFYYYVNTTGTSITIRKSKSIEKLREAEETAVWTAPEDGVFSKEVWAPELHYLKGRWYIYFCADDGDNANHRMYVLEGGSDRNNPLSSAFSFKGKIFDSTDKWAIDGTVLLKKDGSLYMVWSGWEGDINGKQNLYIAPMDNPWTIAGERVLISEPSEPWETIGIPINEGPTVLVRKNKIIIVYSASGSWTEDYCLGMLVNTDGDVLNPASWKKKPHSVFKKSPENNVYGVGHCSFLKPSIVKPYLIVYHAMDKPDAGWQGRSARVQSFKWKRDGMPDFGVPLKSGIVNGRGSI